MPPRNRYKPVIKLVRDAEDLARSGALTIDDGKAAIYFLWGQPTHAYFRRGDEIIEGEAALKEIVLSLGAADVVVWKNKDVVGTETLYCDSAELVEILENVAGATSPTVEPEVAPAPVRGSKGSDEFPLLPNGPPIWADVPSDVVRLEVLARLSTALITFEGDGVHAAGILLDGELYDAMHVDAGVTTYGREAWKLMATGRTGKVSTYEIDGDLAAALPVLWRHQTIQERPIDPSLVDSGFVEEQGVGDQDRALIVRTADASGVVIFLRGAVVGVYTSAERIPTRNTDSLRQLLGAGTSAAITVLERRQDDLASPSRLKAPEEAPVAEAEEMEVPVSPGQNPVGPDYPALLEELTAIGEECLGSDFALLRADLRNAEPTAPGLRQAIQQLRASTVPGRPTEEMAAVARKMTLQVAERCTAT